MDTVDVRKTALAVAIWSLVLSVLAFWTDPVINRDGMYYVHQARLLAAGQSELVLAQTEWPFLVLVLAAPAFLLGMDPLTAGIGLSIVLGTLLPVLAFLLLLRYDRQSVLLAALVACTYPVLFSYRDYIIRDHGAWAFLLLACYSFVVWWQSGGARWLLAAGLSVVMGFLFRTEILFVLLPMVWIGARRGLAMQAGPAARNGMFVALGLLLAALAGAAWLGQDRWHAYLDFLTNKGLLSQLELIQDFIAEHAFQYLADDLPFVLAVGLVALVIKKVITLSGLYALPLVFGVRSHTLGLLKERDGGFSLMLAVLLFALIVMYVLLRAFLVSRYAVPVVIALLPLAYLAMLNWWRRPGRTVIKRWLVGLALVLAVDQSVSTSAGKVYIIEAADWIRAHPQHQEKILFVDNRISFYAGHGYDWLSPEPVPAHVDDTTEVIALSYRGKRGQDADTIARQQAVWGFTRVLFQADNGEGDGALVLAR